MAAATMGLRILAIDDEEDLLRAYQLVLGREHCVVSVTTAEDGLSLIENDGDFDLILCDQQLPAMSGAALLTELRRRRSTLCDRFVLATCDESLGKALNCNVMYKPFSLAELRGVVSAVKRR